LDEETSQKMTTWRAQEDDDDKKQPKEIDWEVDATGS
jgi:hypothetical protein